MTHWMLITRRVQNIKKKQLQPNNSSNETEILVTQILLQQTLKWWLTQTYSKPNIYNLQNQINNQLKLNLEVKLVQSKWYTQKK